MFQTQEPRLCLFPSLQLINIIITRFILDFGSLASTSQIYPLRFPHLSPHPHPPPKENKKTLSIRVLSHLPPIDIFGPTPPSLYLFASNGLLASCTVPTFRRLACVTRDIYPFPSSVPLFPWAVRLQLKCIRFLKKIKKGKKRRKLLNRLSKFSHFFCYVFHFPSRRGRRALAG